MKSYLKPFFSVYLWLVAYPILFVLTVLTAIFTIILSPVFPDSKLSYYPAQFWGRAICKICFVKVRISGLDKLNPAQSYVIVSNHQSFFDVFVMYGWLPMIFRWMMKIELYKIPLVGQACAAAGHIFIDRKNPLSARRSIEIAEKQLQNGISVVIFPEGTRTMTGQMGKFKRGAFFLATDLKLPVVPVTLKGSFERLRKNSFCVNPGTIEMFIHDPIDVSQYLPDQNQQLIQNTREIINSKL